jgi:taurine dioxygenase
MRIVPLTRDIGVEITDIDLKSAVDAGTRGELQSLIDRHHLLSFPGQGLSVDEQVAFIELFGPKTDEAGRGVYHGYVSNRRADSGVHHEAALPWHSDNAWSPAPTHYIALGGEHVVGDLAPTRFASTARAARALPAELRREVQGLRTIIMTDLSPGEKEVPRSRRLRPETRRVWAELPQDEYYFPRTAYPVIWTHPRTGQELLFVNEDTSVRIEGCDMQQSEAIFTKLFAVLYDEAHVYEHHWRQDDLVLWDNLALQHGRRAFHGMAGERTLVRTTINPAQDLYLTHGRVVADFAKKRLAEREMAGSVQ